MITGTTFARSKKIIPYASLAERPAAQIFGEGACRINHQLYVSNSSYWTNEGAGGSHYMFDERPGLVAAGGSIIAFGNLSYTPTISAVIGQSTAVFVLTGNKSVKGSNIWAQGANETEFNGVLSVLSVSGDNVTVQLESPATATAATGTLGALEMESKTDLDFIHLGNCLKNQRALLLGNFAQAGSQTSAHITQLAAALNPANNRFGMTPKIAVIGPAGNSILADVPVATIIADWETMIAMCRAAGALPVFVSMPPISTAYAGYKASWTAAGRYLNDWLETQHAEGVIERINVYADWVNKADAGGGWIANYTADGIHQTTIAAYAAAYSSVSAFFERIRYQSLGYTETELWTNYALTGSSGTVTGTGGSGVTANSTTATVSGGGSQTAVFSKVASYGKSLGEAVKVALTGVAALDAATISMTNSQHALLTAGDLIVVSQRIRNHDAALDADYKYLNAQISLSVDAVTKYAVSGIAGGAASAGFGQGYSDMQVEYPAFEVPAGLTAFNAITQFAFGAGNGGSTVNTVSDWSIKKITFN